MWGKQADARRAKADAQCADAEARRADEEARRAEAARAAAEAAVALGAAGGARPKTARRCAPQSPAPCAVLVVRVKT